MATYEPEAQVALPRTTDEPYVSSGRLPPARWLREIGWRHAVAVVAVAFALYPIAWIVMSSINSVDSLTTVSFVPKSTTTDNYTALFDGCSWKVGIPPWTCSSNTPFPDWLWNSVKIAAIATTLQLIFSALAAYSFARLRWRGRRTGLIAILLIQMFPQFLAFVAIFLLLDSLEQTFSESIKTDLWVATILIVAAAAAFAWLVLTKRLPERYKRWLPWVLGGAAIIFAGMLLSPDYGVTVFPKIGKNTHTGLILVYLGGAIGVNTWLIKGFMDSVPTSLDEAAMVDGANNWQVFSQIVLPLTRPVLVVIFILSFVGLYNEFILAQILITDVKQFTYATGLALFVESEYAAKWGDLSAAAVIGTLPIVGIYMALQDRIVSGLGGAVKG